MYQLIVCQSNICQINTPDNLTCKWNTYQQNTCNNQTQVNQTHSNQTQVSHTCDNYKHVHNYLSSTHISIAHECIIHMIIN